MSKKTLIISFVVLGLILVGLIGYFLLVQKTDTTGGGAPSVFRSFFPFGGSESPVVDNSNNNSTTTEDTNQNQDLPVSEVVKKLRKLTVVPIAGAGLLDTKLGTTVRYIERATGHIYELDLFGDRHERISNTTIPVVYDAVWGDKNNYLVTRYLKDDDQTVETYSIKVTGVSTTTENTISGTAMPSGIDGVSVFGNTVLYLVQNSDSSTGYTSVLGSTKRKQIWNSDLKEVIPQLVNLNTAAFVTKPETGVPGFLYLVDANTAKTTKVLGNIPGLTALVSPDAQQILYSSQDSDSTMYLYDRKNKTSEVLTPATLPEKCVWSTKNKNIIYCAVPMELINGGSLISWYKGTKSFVDNIWKYDTKEKTANIILDPSGESGESIDVIKPLLSENEQFLVFMNKKDGALWSLDLTK